MEIWLAAVGVVVFFAHLVLRHRRRRRDRSQELCRRWGLDEATHRVISCDLGRGRSRKPLLADGLAGNPDVLFRDTRQRRLIVGEAKSRNYRGTITPYERYQVTLYSGMVARLYCRPVSAIILYGNDRRVALEFDEDLYRWLLARAPTCRNALARR